MPAKTASDGPTVSLSFANNFWGKDDAGVGPLLGRMHCAKVTSDELKSFYTTRAQIEEEYAKKLLNLARKPLGSTESGTLRMSLDVVRGEVESMGKAHQMIAGQMKSELEEPLIAFTGGIKERRKIVQNGIEKLLKVKNQQTATLVKSRDRFEQDCLKIKGYLAQGHMVMGQEERKNKAKLEKTQIQMSSDSTEYETAVKVLEETTGRWNREWKAACDKFQDLEEERLDYFKSSLWSFANISSTVCVSDDQSCEKIRLSLEDCEVEKDITSFICEQGTGQEIPDPPKYINFCRNDAEDAMSTHESEDGNYSVAQFARTMNPTFRSASPQPSMFESHNDPDSSLREEMGMAKPRASLQADDAFSAAARSSRGSENFNMQARSSHGSAAPPPLNPSQLSMSSLNNSGPPTTHDQHQAETMSQFGRMGPPSERSTIPSPTRPESRDSQHHSDYSAPTSFSSFDPNSGATSPTKHYDGSAVSSNSAASEDKQIQKKKSGFFQHHSPFRRRSNKSKEFPQQPQSIQVTPTARNTWTPATTRNSESTNTSPTKSFGSAAKNNPWNKRPTASPEPDAVDPRAEYQLGIGNNVFDVASPDARRDLPSARMLDPEQDPIAQALAELKGVTKQATSRQSADRHYGMSTPAPDTPQGRGMPAGAVPTPFAGNGNRATPPPAYDQPMSRLGAPQPAHTSRDMQKTTERFTAQKRDMFNTGASRPGNNAGQAQNTPVRSASPQPPRSASPRPFHTNEQQQQTYRSASPNPYGSGRPRPQTAATPTKQPSYTTSNNNPRGSSPGYQAPRAASPNPAYNRPASSRGSDQGGMAIQLAPVPSPNGNQGHDVYGSQRGGRPQSQYYGNSQDSYSGNQIAARTRSQSVAGQRQFTKDGRAIMHYARAMYMYQAAIPEELSFAKGDVLAITRHQDDGWWEAEVCGKNERLGLVPSNYLKNC